MKNENDSFYHEKSDSINIILDEDVVSNYDQLYELIFKCFYEARHVIK